MSLSLCFFMTSFFYNFANSLLPHISLYSRIKKGYSEYMKEPPFLSLFQLKVFWRAQKKSNFIFKVLKEDAFSFESCFFQPLPMEKLAGIEIDLSSALSFSNAHFQQKNVKASKKSRAEIESRTFFSHYAFMIITKEGLLWKKKPSISLTNSFLLLAGKKTMMMSMTMLHALGATAFFILIFIVTQTQAAGGDCMGCKYF